MSNGSVGIKPHQAPASSRKRCRVIASRFKSSGTEPDLLGQIEPLGPGQDVGVLYITCDFGGLARLHVDVDESMVLFSMISWIG